MENVGLFLINNYSMKLKQNTIFLCMFFWE